jgi:DNA-binding MarR family transcriptional regulator
VGIRITDRDRELLAFLARHRLVYAEHVAALLGVTRHRAGAILARLAGGLYVRRQPVFDRRPAFYRIRRKGLAVIGNRLPPPGLDLRSYEHDVGVAWLWLAARAGTFGPLREIVSERELRSRDEAPGRTEPPLAVRLGGVGRGGRERLHYPDLLLIRPDGRRIALELELTAKARPRLERILAGYGADPRVDAALYLVANRTIGRSVTQAAERLGVDHLVRVQLVRDESRAAGAGGARARELMRSQPAAGQGVERDS